jgi:hypothetical protein
VHVHTIALGLASDQPLLQNIATATGGSYFFSPDELGLFEIYNVARAATADVDMALEDAVALADGDSGQARSFARSIVIEDDVDYADFSVAAQQTHVRLDAELRCLSVPSADLSRLDRKAGPGYAVMRLKRPQPGTYELRVTAWSAGPVTCSVAAYVKSPLRLHLREIGKSFEPGNPIDLAVSIREKGRLARGLSVSALATCPTTSIGLLARQWKREMRLPPDRTGDPSGDELLRAQAVREHLRSSTGKDPVQYARKSVHLVHPNLAHAPRGSMAVRTPTAKTVEGTYNVRLSVQGRTSSGYPFTRVGFRSVRVGSK